MSEVKDTGLEDITIKVEVLCHGRHWHSKVPKSLWPRAQCQGFRSAVVRGLGPIFANSHPQIVHRTSEKKNDSKVYS